MFNNGIRLFKTMQKNGKLIINKVKIYLPINNNKKCLMSFGKEKEKIIAKNNNQNLLKIKMNIKKFIKADHINRALK